MQLLPMDALVASYLIQSALATVLLIALAGFAWVYRRPLHGALALGWSLYLVQLVATFAAAVFGRSNPEASRQWLTATVQLLGVAGSCVAWLVAVRLLAEQQTTLRVPRLAVGVALLMVTGLLAASAVAGTVLHQPGSGPLKYAYPVPYLALAAVAWHAAARAPRHAVLLRWMSVAFLLVVVRLVTITSIVLPEAAFANASLRTLLIVAMIQLVQMVGMGTISLAVAAAFEREAVTRQAARIRDAELQAERTLRLEMLGRMAAGVAHDVNNVMTAVLGAIEIADDAAMEPATVRSELAGAKRSVATATGLTSRLLAFARAKDTVDSPASLDDVIRSAEPMLRRLVDSRISLSLSLDAQAATVPVSAAGVEQVLLNLVTNARDAIRGQGTIAIATQVSQFAQPRRVTDGVLPAGRYACLSVQDSGTGIALDVVPRIFDPFFTTKGDGGTGIGLATVRRVALAARGDVDVSTAADRGTRFDIFVPVMA